MHLLTQNLVFFKKQLQKLNDSILGGQCLYTVRLFCIPSIIGCSLTGFDVELTELIAEDLGYKVEWVTSDFSGIMGQLGSGKLDTVANAVAITPERQELHVDPL